MRDLLKKTLIAGIFVITTIVSLTGCGTQVKGVCQACRETKPLYELTTSGSIMGFSRNDTFHLCKSCADDVINELKENSLVGSVVTHDLKPLRKYR